MGNELEKGKNSEYLGFSSFEGKYSSIYGKERTKIIRENDEYIYIYIYIYI